MARILIAEDERDIRDLVEFTLKYAGHDVFKASNGAEAVELAPSVKPDLILMDVVMPGLNGFQATRQLTRDAETKDIPVIIVTTKDQETDRVWGLRQGAKDFLTKPVSEKVLMEKINAALELV